MGRPPGPGAGPAGVGRQRPWPRGAGESVRSRRTRATVQALWGPSVSHEPSWTPELDSTRELWVEFEFGGCARLVVAPSVGCRV